MTLEQMKEFVLQRIQSVENKDINDNLSNTNGLLLHFIPEDLTDESPIDWENREHKNNVLHAFRRFTELDTTYSSETDKVYGYTPDREYFICFQNGITEVYKHPVELQNSLNRNFAYIKVDSQFYAIRDFINASVAVHQKIYGTSGPYHIFISILGVYGTYFASFDKRYVTTVPFPSNNLRFEPFTLPSLDFNLMPEITNGVHYGLKANGNWTRN